VEVSPFLAGPVYGIMVPLVAGGSRHGYFVLAAGSSGYDVDEPLPPPDDPQTSLKLLATTCWADKSKKFPSEHNCPHVLMFMGTRPTGRAVVFDCMRSVT